MNLFDLDDRVTAAAVAATGTIIGAVIQLRAAWRREVSERARGTPMTKKSRRGPVLAVFLLVFAAGVGGFAFSQYLVKQWDRDSAAAVRGELQQQLAQINATAQRLERATLGEHEAAAHAEGDPGGAADVTVTMTVGPCHARAAGADAAPPCSEQEALRVTLCGSVPLSAVVNEVTVYARPEDSARPWPESKAAPGQDVGQARFSEKPFERAESDQTRQVCTAFVDWDGEHATSARLVVKYTAPPASGLRSASAATTAAHEEAHATVMPISEQVKVP